MGESGSGGERPGERSGDRLGSREVFRGRTVRLDVDSVRLPNGREMDFEMVRHPGAAAVVPLADDGQVLLVRQYRYATGGWILEVPAGKLDGGEAPEDCARREVEEETGFRPRRLESLGWIWTSPGFTDERIWLFLARGLAPGRQELGHDEVLALERVPFERAVEMAAGGPGGEISDAKSICALLRAARRLRGEGGAAGDAGAGGDPGEARADRAGGEGGDPGEGGGEEWI
jgi:ADP-ribose diphosphatase